MGPLTAARPRLGSVVSVLARGGMATLAGLALTDCVSGTSTTVQHITQSALVPVAMGPRALGPLVAEGRVAVEGALATAATADATGSRAEGRPGQFNGTSIAALRVSGSPHGRVELGLSAEYTSGYWSSPAATDLAPDDLHRSDAWRSSAGVRWLFAGDRAGGVGLLGELGVASLPFRREVSSETTFTVRGTVAPPGAISFGTVASRDTRSLTELTWQLGLFSTFQVVPNVDVGAGFVAQNQPYVVGAQTATSRCDYLRGQLFAVSCSGTDAAHTARSETDVLGTAFVTAGVTVGRVTFLGQVHAHLFGAAQTTALSRFGGTLGARVAVF